MIVVSFLVRHGHAHGHRSGNLARRLFLGTILPLLIIAACGPSGRVTRLVGTVRAKTLAEELAVVVVGHVEVWIVLLGDYRLVRGGRRTLTVDLAGVGGGDEADDGDDGGSLHGDGCVGGLDKRDAV